ncbi:Dehydrogenase, partial [Globisporangium splendens]
MVLLICVQVAPSESMLTLSCCVGWAACRYAAMAYCASNQSPPHYAAVCESSRLQQRPQHLSARASIDAHTSLHETSTSATCASLSPQRITARSTEVSATDGQISHGDLQNWVLCGRAVVPSPSFPNPTSAAHSRALQKKHQSPAMSKVWLITGCSSGLGRELALAALARGDRVIATARNVNKLDDLKQRGAAAVSLDVTSSDHVLKQIIADAVAIYGRIDILVNNAGYVLQGAVEECSASEIYDQFNTNVFGITNMIRAVLPYLRAQKSGVVANVGSIAGWRGSSVTGIYSASKFAVAGLSESLRAEVAHLGIEVTSVDFGAFRTILFGENMIQAKNTIDDLSVITEPRIKALAARSGHQRGDPIKAAALLYEALTRSGRCEGRTIPSRLVIGKDAVEGVAIVLEKDQQELQAWADLSTTTDCDDVAQ